jgi:hypothetical protein
MAGSFMTIAITTAESDTNTIPISHTCFQTIRAMDSGDISGAIPNDFGALMLGVIFGAVCKTGLQQHRQCQTGGSNEKRWGVSVTSTCSMMFEAHSSQSSATMSEIMGMLESGYEGA